MKTSNINLGTVKNLSLEKLKSIIEEAQRKLSHDFSDDQIFLNIEDQNDGEDMKISLFATRPFTPKEIAEQTRLKEQSLAEEKQEKAQREHQEKQKERNSAPQRLTQVKEAILQKEAQIQKLQQRISKTNPTLPGYPSMLKKELKAISDLDELKIELQVVEALLSSPI